MLGLSFLVAEAGEVEDESVDHVAGIRKREFLVVFVVQTVPHRLKVRTLRVEAENSEQLLVAHISDYAERGELPDLILSGFDHARAPFVCCTVGFVMKGDR